MFTMSHNKRVIPSLCGLFLIVVSSQGDEPELGALGDHAAKPDNDPIYIELTDGEDASAAIAAHGIDVAKWKAARKQWAIQKGYPPESGYYEGTLQLVHPYHLYDEVKLQGMAAQGDTWAMQYLGDKLRRESPAEAYYWYYEAALHGSSYALTQISRIYKAAARPGSFTEAPWNYEPEARQQLMTLADTAYSPEIYAAAWSVALQFDHPVYLDGIIEPRFGKYQSIADFPEICRLGKQLYDELELSRADREQEYQAIRPSPFMVSPPPGTHSCGPEYVNEIDTSSCQIFAISYQDTGEQISIAVCYD